MKWLIRKGIHCQ